MCRMVRRPNRLPKQILQLMAGCMCHIQPIMKRPVSVERCQNQYPTSGRSKDQISDRSAGGSGDYFRTRKHFYLLLHREVFGHDDLKTPCTENLLDFILIDEVEQVSRARGTCS